MKTMKRIPAALSAVLILAAAVREGYLWVEDRWTLPEDHEVTAEKRRGRVEERPMSADNHPIRAEILAE